MSLRDRIQVAVLLTLVSLATEPSRWPRFYILSILFKSEC